MILEECFGIAAPIKCFVFVITFRISGHVINDVYLNDWCMVSHFADLNSNEY